MTKPDDTKSVWEQMTPYKHVELKPNRTKPDDIPQDVWAAVKVWIDWYADTPASIVEEAMARAIMAEREACAQVAWEVATHNPKPAANPTGHTVWVALDGPAIARAERVAAAIRNRGEIA